MFRPVVVTAFVLVAAHALAQKNETEVRAVYAKMNTLIAKKDVKGLVALFERTAAPDFFSEMNGQRSGRAQFSAGLKQGISMKDGPTAYGKILSSKSSGKTLVLNIEWAMKGKGADGKPYAMVLSSINTWQKMPRGYRLKKVIQSVKS